MVTVLLNYALVFNQLLIFATLTVAARIVQENSTQIYPQQICPTYVSNSSGIFMIPMTCATYQTKCCQSYDGSADAFCCQEIFTNPDPPPILAIVGGVIGGLMITGLISMSVRKRICYSKQARVALDVTAQATPSVAGQQQAHGRMESQMETNNTRNNNSNDVTQRDTVVDTSTLPDYGMIRDNGVTNGYARYGPPPSYSSVINHTSHHNHHHHHDNGNNNSNSNCDNAQSDVPYEDPPPSYYEATSANGCNRSNQDSGT